MIVTLTLNFCRKFTCFTDSYKLSQRTSVPGNEIDCKYKDDKGQYQKFCKVCGGVEAVATSCSANPSCKSFDMEGTSCGYLKSAHNPEYTDNFDSYSKS